MSLDALNRLLESRPAQLVRGHFDPLLAEHAQRLSNAAKPGLTLAVVVTNPPHPLMAARARAELVAGLAAVDYVAIAEDSAVAADARQDDVARRFIEHVHLKHKESSA